MAAYSTDAQIRARSGVTVAEVSTTYMTELISQVDKEIDNILQNAYYYVEMIEDQGDERVMIMPNHTTVSDFIKVEIDGDELFEEDKIELMSNTDVEKIDSDATGGVEDWQSASGTSATYTHSNTAYRGRKSLLITAVTQETAYWETTNDITVSFPQGIRMPAYILTYYVKATSITAGAGNGAYAQILWYDGSDTLLATDSDVATVVTGTEDWAKRTMTKYAPDTASKVVIRLINDAESGTVYFDSLKFRTANWVDKASDASIDLLKSYPDKFIIVWYSKTATINPIVENLAIDLTARAALVHATGGTVQGLSYKIDVLQVNKSKQSKERTQMISQLTNLIQSKILRFAEQGLLKDNKRDWFVGLNTLD